MTNVGNDPDPTISGRSGGLSALRGNVSLSGKRDHPSLFHGLALRITAFADPIIARMEMGSTLFT